MTIAELVKFTIYWHQQYSRNSEREIPLININLPSLIEIYVSFPNFM